MAETTARQFIFAALFFTAIITGCFVLISSGIPEGGNTDFDEYNNSFAKFNEIRAEANSIREPVEGAEPASGELGILNGLIESSFGSINLVWASVTTMGTILLDLTSSFGIPGWFTALLIAILGVTITFALMAAWFKWHI